VRVTFHVQQGIRGSARDGQSFSIEEWAGLWSDGPRYRVGERLALFLYPASKLGLTSPVAGSWGQLRLDSQSRLRLPPGWERAIAASSPDSSEQPGPYVHLPTFARAVRRLAEER
jgi:hypothetical protein